MTANEKNAFDWQGEPSIFSKLHQFTGLYEEKSTRMTQADKKHITYAKGDTLQQPPTAQRSVTPLVVKKRDKAPISSGDKP